MPQCPPRPLPRTSTSPNLATLFVFLTAPLSDAVQVRDRVHLVLLREEEAALRRATPWDLLCTNAFKPLRHTPLDPASHEPQIFKKHGDIKKRDGHSSEVLGPCKSIGY